MTFIRPERAKKKEEEGKKLVLPVRLRVFRRKLSSGDVSEHLIYGTDFFLRFLHRTV